MGKSLVIVESPAKVKTLGKFLGSQYIVKSSVGHIRDLAKPVVTSTKAKAKAKGTAKKKKKTPKEAEAEKYQKLIEKMGINPLKAWEAHYDILPGKEKVVKQLQEAAKKVDTIYLATDLDREGEAIAWHLREAIGGDHSKYKRVTFTEITKKAVVEAFKVPTELNQNRVYAQQTRRFLDRLVGFMLSPLLWRKVARGLSAGRVQSVALRMISERESSIHAFKPEEYWEVKANLDVKAGAEKEILKLEVVKEKSKAFRPTSEEECQKALEKLEKGSYKVSSVEKKPGKSKSSAPYITSTLQQAASLRLRYGVKKTMTLAQKLYEAGFITYMRTDSTNISNEALESCRDYILKTYGKDYCPKDPNIYSSKKSAQEAHEAIRPTDLNLGESSVLTQLGSDAAKLYLLIWRQFVACQMTGAQYDLTKVTVHCDDFELRIRGRVMTFDGFLRVQPPSQKSSDKGDVVLPPVEEGAILNLENLDPSQHFTKPPPRFTEASLVRELEKKSIGRPSTYAAIISTIQERGYVKAEQRRFFCLKMGEVVSVRLVESFENLMNYDFTANLEEKLDHIAEGQKVWTDVLDVFYLELIEALKNAEEGMRSCDPILVPSISCPNCEKPMTIRVARTGVFLGCSGYSLPPKERCTETMNLVSGDEVEAYSDDDEEGNVEELQAKRRCESCDTAMDSYLLDTERRLHLCGRFPDCDASFLEKGQFRIKGYEGPVIPCDKCSNDMQLKSGRFGKYFACTADECSNTRKLLKSGEAAPPKADPIHMPELKCEKSDGYFVLRDGAAGIFLASSLFPKSRETKKPCVSDLIRHSKDLDPKFHNLLKAPEADPNGNPSIVRFSRKTKTHYIGSMKGDKASNWVLIWNGKAWVKSTD